ncbi:MAG: D-alanyl-D-alanine carboxypeptidase/D-alanyl-D-alanine-endopeptidase [Candidatus Kapaibacteriales bacterium]
MKSLKQPDLKPGLNSEVGVGKKILPWIGKSDSLNSIKDLHDDLDRIIAQYDTKRTRIGMSVYSMDRGEYIYQRSADKLFTPASNTKIFTVMASFFIRGDGGTINTTLFTNGYLDMDTVLVGDLFIRGEGNVFLRGEDLAVFAERLAMMKIKRVTGNIYIDEGHFDGNYDRFKYSGDADVVQKLPDIKPVILADSHLEITVSADDLLGGGVSYTVSPPSTVFEVVSNASATVGGSRGDIYSAPEPSFGSYWWQSSQRYGDATETFDAEVDVPEEYETSDLARRKKSSNLQSKHGITVTQKYSHDTLQRFEITGKMRSGQSETFRFPIKDMQQVVGGSLEYFLLEKGITLEGKIGYGTINGYKENERIALATVGYPLEEMAMPINKKSNNFIAEQMFKFVGGTADTAKNYRGYQKIFKAMLDTLEIECDGCKLNDGSGLSRRNLLTPNSLVEVLLASEEVPYSGVMANTLGIAGVDGTIRKRMRKSLAQGNLRAKTGTLRNVSALSGFVTTKDGERLVFSILSNGPSPYKYKRMEDELGIKLAEFHYFTNTGG